MSFLIFTLQNVQKEKMEVKIKEKIYFIFILCNGLEKNVMAHKNKLLVVLTLTSVQALLKLTHYSEIQSTQTTFI